MLVLLAGMLLSSPSPPEVGVLVLASAARLSLRSADLVARDFPLALSRTALAPLAPAPTLVSPSPPVVWAWTPRLNAPAIINSASCFFMEDLLRLVGAATRCAA